MDDAAFALSHGSFGILIILVGNVRLPQLFVYEHRCTYGILAESERHVLLVTADLDKDDAKLAEVSGHFSLESIVLDSLRQTGDIQSVVSPERHSIQSDETYLATKTQAVDG